MFSPMIKNLISSSGQQTAMQRSVQLQNYVNNFNSQINGIQPPENKNIESFSKVLKATSQEAQFGSLVKRIPSESARASIFGNSAIEEASSVQNSIQNGISKNASKSQILAMIDNVAKKHGVDEKLVRALVRQESGFNPKATSHCGAMGLMQLMPATAKGLGVKDAYNPVENVEGGVKYLKNLLNKYNGNVILSLAAYNAGPGAVDKYDGVPPYSETQNYVKSILANYL